MEFFIIIGIAAVLVAPIAFVEWLHLKRFNGDQ